jgi:PAS domain S-box-containing protein
MADRHRAAFCLAIIASALIAQALLGAPSFAQSPAPGGVPEIRLDAADLPTWFDRNQHLLLAGSLLAIGQSLLIAWLLAERRARRRAESLSRLTHERLQQAIDESMVLVWDWDIAADETTWLGRRFHDLGFSAHVPAEGRATSIAGSGHGPSTGSSAGVVDAGRTWRAALHPLDVPRVLSAIDDHLLRSVAYDIEYRLQMRDGGYRWFRSRGACSRDPDGRPIRMRGTLTDVHERVQAAELAQQGDTRFRQIANTVEQVFWIAKPLEPDGSGGQVVYLSPYFERVWDIPVETAIRDPGAWWSTVHPDDLSRVQTAASELRPDRSGRFEAEYRIIRADKSERWVRAKGSLVRDAEGRPSASVGLIEDVTDRVLVERRVRQSEASSRRLIETALEGIWIVGETWQTTFANARMAEMLGLMPETMLGRPITDFMDDVGRADAAEKISRRERGLSEIHEFRFVHADGRDIWTLVATSPMTDAGGKFIGAMAMVTDISALKATELALRRERTLFLSGPAVVWRWRAEPGWPVAYVSDNVRTYGYQPEDFTSGRVPFASIVDPEAISRLSGEIAECIRTGQRYFEQQYRIRHADGRWIWLRDYSVIERNSVGEVIGYAGYTLDVTRERGADRFQESQRRILEDIAAARPLGSILQQLAQMVDAQDERVRAAVLEVTPDRGLSVHVASSMPAPWQHLIENARNIDAINPCSQALRELRRVAIDDIAAAPFDDDFRRAALEAGFSVAMCEPVLGQDNAAIGVLAAFSGGPSASTTSLQEVTRVAAHIAGVAIARHRSDQALRQSQSKNQALIEAIPDILLQMSRDGCFVSYHGALPSQRKLPLLVPLDQISGRRPSECFPPRIALSIEKSLRKLVETGIPQSVNLDVGVHESFQALEVRMTLSGADEALVLIRDITQRRLTERRLTDSQQRLRAMIDHAPFPVTLWDTDGIILEWNQAAARVFGWSTSEAIGRAIWFIVPEAERVYVQGIYREILKSRTVQVGNNFNVRKDARQIRCEWHNVPLTDEQGKIFACASMVRDITEELESAERQQVMVRELNHRVKNNLATVIAIAEQTGRASGGYAGFLEAFTERIRALGRTHDALAAAHWRGAAIRSVVVNSTEAFVDKRGGRAELDGPDDIIVDAQTAQALAMALHELATNAAKYGAFSVASGAVHVRWRLTGPPAGESSDQVSHFELTWHERGGPPVVPPAGEGFGTSFIMSVIRHELRGDVSLDFDPAGVRFAMRAPISRPTAPDNRSTAEYPPPDGSGHADGPAISPHLSNEAPGSR